MSSGAIRIFDWAEQLPSRLAWLSLAAVRVTVGWVFLQSGWGKLHNLEGVVAFFESLGIPFAALQAPFVAGLEFVGGALVLAGLGTRLVALPLVGVMVVAIATALRSELESVSDLFGLSEFGYIVMLVSLFVFGAGSLSLDALIRRRLGVRG
ncbi:MAG: DoxX family protein [Deltaproteobacteria bacterium]|nr:DoxX family protein [Deltaproteobacteria bacterium]